MKVKSTLDALPPICESSTRAPVDDELERRPGGLDLPRCLPALRATVRALCAPAPFSSPGSRASRGRCVVGRLRLLSELALRGPHPLAVEKVPVGAP